MNPAARAPWPSSKSAAVHWETMKQAILSIRYVLVCGLIVTASAPLRANEDLDAELDATWGSKRTQAVETQNPESRYRARLKILEAMRDASLARCARTSGGQRYCRQYAQEDFRKNVRALDSEFKDQLGEIPREVKSKGFHR